MVISATAATAELGEAVVRLASYRAVKADQAVLASILKIQASKVKLEGEAHLQAYDDSATMSGNTIQRKFCRNCGSCVLKCTPRSPDSYDISMGLFSLVPVPEMEAFRKSRQDWEHEVQWPVTKRFEALPGK